MFHVKLEPSNEPKYMSYMSSMPSTSTTIPGSELFETQQKIEYHDKLFKMEEDFEKLHLNVQDESETFKDDIQRRLPIKDENGSGITILKCKMCYQTFKSSVKFNFHANEVNHYDWLCLACHQRDKMIESFEKLHLNNVQDEMNLNNIQYETKIVKDEVVNNTERLIKRLITKKIIQRHYDKDESGKTILKCKTCYKTFKCSIKFKFHDNEVHRYDWLCLDCCQRDNFVRRRYIDCTLCYSKKFYDKSGLRNHCRAKHPGELPYDIPRRPVPFDLLFPIATLTMSISPQTPKIFAHECIPYQFPSRFPQFPTYQLKCKICDEISYTHSEFNSHAQLHGFFSLCDHCSQAFLLNNHKKQHLKMEHENELYVYRRRFNNLGSDCGAIDHFIRRSRESRESRESIQHPMMTRSRKRKLLDDLIVLKMKNCSLNDVESEEADDGYIKRIKR